MMLAALVPGFEPLLAHQYGWDEIAMFLVPIGLAIAGVRYAEHRAAEKKRAAEDQPAASSSDGDSPR